MKDTPLHIKKLQLEIWLKKTPMERLAQFLYDNDAQFRVWKELKENLESQTKGKNHSPSLNQNNDHS